MSPNMFHNLDDGACDQISKGLNEGDFVKIKLKQRGMANMKYYKGTETVVLGKKVSCPIGFAAIP